MQPGLKDFITDIGVHTIRGRYDQFSAAVIIHRNNLANHKRTSDSSKRDLHKEIIEDDFRVIHVLHARHIAQGHRIRTSANYINWIAEPNERSVENQLLRGALCQQ